MEKSESIIELSKALAKFQQEVKQPMKDADNPFFKSKYVPLESVVEAITNCAPKHGISFLQYPCNNDEGRIGIATVVTHTSGEYMEFDPVFMRPEKDTPQGLGSVLSYLRRYSLSAIFGITSDQDDDGNESSGNNRKPIKQKQVGVIKSRVLTFADMRKKKPLEVYKAINLTENGIEKLSEDQALDIIEKLDGWIKKADKEDAQKSQGA